MRRYFGDDLFGKLFSIIKGLVDHHNVGVLGLSDAIIVIPEVLVHRVASGPVSRGGGAGMLNSPIELLKVSHV